MGDHASELGPIAFDFDEGAAKLGLNEHQLVTLASIVQKEAGNNDEMPLIAVNGDTASSAQHGALEDPLG